MAVKATWKRRIQNALTDNSKGFFVDESWKGVYDVFAAVRKLGADLTILGSEYQQDADGNPILKRWHYMVEVEGFIFHGILVASGAGTVKDPLARYDIAAYLTR